MKKILPIHGFCAAVILAAALITAMPLQARQVKPSASGYAPVNGVKIYYEVYGQGKPLILLHGAFYTIGLNWSELIPELAKTRKVIAIEFQGHGHSPYSGRRMTLKTFASDVTGVLDYLGIDSADVAGYSMGGSVAYQVAVQSPARVRKLVIISSVYKAKGWLPITNNALKGLSPGVFDNTPLHDIYMASAPDTTRWRSFVKQMLVFAGEPFNCGDSNIAKIKAPVLIISGDNDGIDKIELMKTYRLLGGGVAADMQPMPKSQLAIIPSQSHVSVIMQTATIVTYLNNFLQ